MKTALLETNVRGVPLPYRGKVRDVYDLDDSLLIVATDRISAYDCVMPNGIPDKGKILTAMSLFWFRFLRDVIDNHVITSEIQEYPEVLRAQADLFEGRSMLVNKARRFDVECIVRGYISGSGWKDYRKTGTISGLSLPPGLRESERLPEPIFTPSTKAEVGHDENVSFETMRNLVGREQADFMRTKSVELYRRAEEYASERGIIIADTKFEFGLFKDSIILIDEVLSPDSSRFWPREEYEPGRPQHSFDKQFVRNYLETLEWDKRPPAPELPEEIVMKTRERYIEAVQRLGIGDFEW